jgi:hypothetical protein
MCEETGMSAKVRGEDGQAVRARHGDGDGFVPHEADGRRVVDGRDTDRFCRFKKTEPGALRGCFQDIGLIALRDEIEQRGDRDMPFQQIDVVSPSSQLVHHGQWHTLMVISFFDDEA